MFRYFALPGGVAAPTLAVGLTVLRIVTGLVFFMHGYQKLFDDGIDRTEAFFRTIEAPFPQFTAPLVTYLEFAGGLALMIGLLTQLVAILLVVDMVAALLLVNAENGFFVTNNGFELVLLLGGAALTLTLTGPGAVSVYNLLGGSRPGGPIRT
jgi:putative oxidoreductase